MDSEEDNGRIVRRKGGDMGDNIGEDSEEDRGEDSEEDSGGG